KNPRRPLQLRVGATARNLLRPIGLRGARRVNGTKGGHPQRKGATMPPGTRHETSQTSLNRLNFQHLQYLQALVEERHVTRAAERMGIGQPAMSTALARLREVFKD